jgi:hypothetical protein
MLVSLVAPLLLSLLSLPSTLPSVTLIVRVVCLSRRRRGVSSAALRANRRRAMSARHASQRAVLARHAEDASSARLDDVQRRLEEERARALASKVTPV